MKKLSFWMILFVLALVIISVKAVDVVISRTTRGMMVQGGTNDLSGNTVVVSDSNTNEYKIVQLTATVAGAATAYSNTFATPFLLSPVVMRGTISGQGSQNQSNNVNVTFTITSSNIVVGALSTNATTGVNNLPLILYGTQRTGKFE